MGCVDEQPRRTWLELIARSIPVVKCVFRSQWAHRAINAPMILPGDQARRSAGPAVIDAEVLTHWPSCTSCGTATALLRGAQFRMTTKSQEVAGVG